MIRIKGRMPRRITKSPLIGPAGAEASAISPNHRGKLAARPNVSSKICWIEESEPNSPAKTHDCTRIDSCIWRWTSVSRRPDHSVMSAKGRRLSRGKVSGWRRPSQMTEMSEKTKKAKKIARQPKPKMIHAPISGAMAGKIVKTSMA